MKNSTKLTNHIAKLASSGLCVAFSGGVDSAVLLKAACDASSEKVHAVTMFTPFHNPTEPEFAKNLAEQLGAVHSIISLENMPDDVMQNPPDRCYLCKKLVFSSIQKYAAEHGLEHVMDGTNADDLNEYRPGLRALTELKIHSPLADLGFSKAVVREIAAEMDLVVAKKPSAPCLATRFPYNTPINTAVLQQVHEIEQAVKAAGVPIVRARVHEDTIRLEVQPQEFEKILAHRESLLKLVRSAGFERFTLDLAGYSSGSFDAPYIVN